MRTIAPSPRPLIWRPSSLNDARLLGGRFRDILPANRPRIVVRQAGLHESSGVSLCIGSLAADTQGDGNMLGRLATWGSTASECVAALWRCMSGKWRVHPISLRKTLASQKRWGGADVGLPVLRLRPGECGEPKLAPIPIAGEEVQIVRKWALT